MSLSRSGRQILEHDIGIASGEERKLGELSDNSVPVLDRRPGRECCTRIGARQYVPQYRKRGEGELDAPERTRAERVGDMATERMRRGGRGMG